MGFGEWLEQVSFGSSMPRLNCCLGLYLGMDSIYLTEVQASGGKPQVNHLLRLPTPVGGAGRDTKTNMTLNADSLAETERMAEAIGKAMEEVSWKTKDVMITLSNDFGILRYFTLPAIDRRFWKTAVPSEAKKYIPIPFASLASDYQIMPLPVGADRRPKLGALFAVTQRKNMESLQQLAEKLGLNVVGTEVAPCSVERLWDALEPGRPSYAQVHFDGGQIRILVSEKGMPIFFREVFLGAEAAFIDRRKVDLAGCVDFCRKQLGSEGPSALKVSGQAGNIAAWRDAFSQDLGQPVAVNETEKQLGLKEGQWGAYAAIGAALRHQAPTALTVDLSNVGKISDEDRRAARAIFMLAGAISAFFLLVGGIKHGQAYYAERRLASLRSSGAEVLEIFRGQSVEDIEGTIAKMRDKVSSFGALTTQSLPLTHVMESIADDIPDSAWTTAINYSNPLSVSATKAPRRLTINGKVVAADRGAEQDIAFQFAENLRKDKRFSQAFPSVDPSLEASDQASIQDAEKRTRFVIQCQSAKDRPS